MPEAVDEGLVEVLESGPASSGGDRRLYLMAGDNEQKAYELPGVLSGVLLQVIDAMREGLAVTVKPESQQLTTSQVADLLGVTRPTVVKLLESGALPYSRVGTHRRVRLCDVLQYRDSRREQRYSFLADTQVENEPPRAEVLADLKRIRAELGNVRRQATHG